MSRSSPWNLRTVNGDGVFKYGTYKFDVATSNALRGAKWRVNPKTIPKSLKKAWLHIEFGRFNAAAADVAKALKSKKTKTIKAAKKLDSAITYHLEGIVGEALYQEEQGNKFAALRIYNELLQKYAGYPLDKRIKGTADEMSKDPDLQGEIAAMDEFYAAKKIAVRSSASARRRGIAKLENIIRDSPDTVASDEAEQLIERLQQ